MGQLLAGSRKDNGVPQVKGYWGPLGSLDPKSTAYLDAFAENQKAAGFATYGLQSRIPGVYSYRAEL